MAWYRAGGGGIPASVKTDMNNVLNKKMGTSGQTYPPTEWADDVNLMGLLEEKTISSDSGVSFTDGADVVPLSSLVCEHRPIVDTTNSMTITQTHDGIVVTTTLNFSQSMCGGYIDAISLVGVMTHKRVKISDLNWTYYTGGTNPIFYANNVTDMLTYARGEMPSIVLSGYDVRTAHSRSYLSTNMANYECSAIENAQTIAFRQDNYTSKDAMLAAMGDRYITFEVVETAYQSITASYGSASQKTMYSYSGANTISTTRGGVTVTYRSQGTTTPVHTDTYVRPSNYPDIDKLASTLTDSDEVVYLTYDLSVGERFIGFYVSGSSVSLQRGYVVNNRFVSEYAHTINGSTSYSEALDPANGMVQLWRVINNGSNHISNLKFDASTSAPGSQQCCVERKGNLNWLNAPNGTEMRSYATHFMKYDALTIGKNASITSLASIWFNCINLEKLDVSGWDTSGWAVTTLASTWYNCVKLKELNVSGWTTTNWAVTSLSSTFYNCTNLKKLDLSNWNTTNWVVTNFTNTWYGCTSITELKVSNWNTSNWEVPSLSYLFSNCTNLIELDLHGWDTSNWPVNNINSIWNNNTHLTTLNLTGWDTSGWTITAASSTWSNCFSLTNYSGISIGVSHTYQSSSFLTVQSLVSILTLLPTVTGSKTLTLGTTNKNKLTAEQLAIATNKGWTIA